jgi:predicted metal-binding protein
MKAMSVDLSIGLCCVISVIVCKSCGLRWLEPGSTNSNKSNTIITAQLSQLLHRHTAPTENNPYQLHLFD